MWNTKYVANRWLSVEYPGDGKTPFRDNGIQHSLTDYQIEDAGFIALRDVTLGYDLPRKAARKVGLSKLRVYVSAQNLLYLWSDGYRGINPEARYASGIPDGYGQKCFAERSIPYSTHLQCWSEY